MSDPTSEPASTEPQALRLLLWRRMSGVGGLVLAASFFLPAIKACSSPIIPAQELWSTLYDQPRSLDDWAFGFLFLIAAYLFGLLALIIAVRSSRTRRVASRTQGASVAVLLGLAVAVLLASIGAAKWDELSSTGTLDWDDDAAILMVIAIVAAVYWGLGVRRGPGGLLSLRWFAAVLCLIWFGIWLVSVPANTYCGLWLSLLGSGLIFAGAWGEAKVRSRGTAWATLGRLATCRLKPLDRNDPRCRSCDYLLIGLTTPRCPECGQPFDWNDYAPDLLPPPDAA